MLNLKLLPFFLSLILIGRPASAQTLDSLLKAVVAHNPSLKAVELQYQIALKEAERVGYSKLNFGLGGSILPPETRLGSQVVMFSIQQVFPWFGTLEAEKNLRLTMSKIEYEKITLLRLDLFHRLKVAYYRLHLLEQKQTVIRASLQFYEILKNIALIKVQNGTANSAAAIRIQIDIQDLEYQIKIFDNTKKRYYATINTLIDQPPNQIISPSELDTIALLDLNLEDLKNKVSSHQPLIAQLNHRIKAAQQTQRLNQKQGQPGFGIGLDYSIVNPRTDAEPQANGRNIMIPKLMLSIPLDRKVYTVKDQQEQLRQELLEYEKQNQINNFFEQLETYKVNYQNAILKIELLKRQKESIRAAYTILLTEYSSTGSGFEALLKLQNQLLNYNLQLWEAAFETHYQKANLERLTQF